MMASIDFSSKLADEGKKVLFVLGDMKELGDSSQNAHTTIGKKVKEIQNSLAFFVGPEMNYAYQEVSSKNAFYFINNGEEDFCQIMNKIEELAENNDVLLLKGSHSMQLEKLVDLFLKNGGEVKNESL